MTTIAQLKEARSRAKAKLTSVSRQLISNTNLNIIDDLHGSLQQAYTDFIDIHFHFSELVFEGSDPTVGIVGGLDLKHYLDSALVLYGEANEVYADQKAQGLALQVEIAIEKAGVLIQQLDRGNRGDAIFEEAESISFLCNDYHKQLSSVGYKGELVSDLSQCIKELDVKVLKSKETPPDSVHFAPSFSRDPESHYESRTNPVSASNTNISTDQLGGRAGHSQPGGSDRPARGSGADDAQFNPDISVVSAYARNAQRLPSILTSSVMPNVSGSSSTQNSNSSRSKFKKSPPPVFSGNRREWAEFRAVWQHYGATEFTDDAQRAWALKGCLKGKALDCVKAIYITQPDAYVRMWQRLDSIYSDISLSVQAAYDDLKKLKPVREDDLKGLVKLVNDVELCYSQLGEVCQINSVTMTHIDELCDLLPITVRKDWMKVYRDLTVEEKIHPFSSFMTFLESERSVAIRLSERESKSKPVSQQKSVHQARVHQSTTESTRKSSTFVTPALSCLIHNKSTAKHSTEKCTKFIAMSVPERLSVLKNARACFRCFGLHMRTDCKSNGLCSVCNADTHHSLLCRDANTNVDKSVVDENKTVTNPTKTSYHSDVHSQDTVYPIQQVPVVGSKRNAAVFFDGGSNATFISERAVSTLKAKRLNKVDLNLVTMGNNEMSYSTSLYEIKLVRVDQSVAVIQAYGIPEIMGEVKVLDPLIVKNLFPGFPTDYLPGSSLVDLLIGNDYYGLHPKREVQRAGEHLGMLEGPLGVCIQGSHPDLNYGNAVTSSCQAYSCSFHVKSTRQPTHVQLGEEVLSSKRGKTEAFVTGEELGTEIVPRCGGCKCMKCPLPGHTFSFNEERELDMIRRNLRYDSEGKRWITSYPWISDPSNLPDNYSSALATLKSTERKLKSDSKWGEIYKSQIEDMVTRNVARKLNSQEIDEWDGPIFYISHLAVVNPKSSTTPVRIVFNSSQKFEGVSLNSFLAKGPDNYLNSLLGILLRWREKEVVLVNDIRKMYNSVYISPVEQHCHRFLWRDLAEREPDVYVIQRVNMGDKPAGAISTEAVYKTADMFEVKYPQACELLRKSTYVDDIVHSVSTVEEAQQLSKDTEYVLSEAGFTLKGWKFNSPLLSPDEEVQQLRILGLQWEPKDDVIVFQPLLNFSTKKKGVYTGANLTTVDIPSLIPERLTRRMVLEQVMKLYDPLGILSPFTLTAKVLLRKTWEPELKLGWDEAMPAELHGKWVKFFVELFKISDLHYDRCLSPSSRVGDPVLVILSDGSEVAYGASAYIRWQLDNGNFWSRLIMAKCRIAPIKRISTPHMELNGAVLSKRIRKVLEQEHRIQFSRVYHLLDSATVLNMINKLSTRFRVYEGVRIGEIQSASDGDMSEWFWVPGQENIADWATRCKRPDELEPDSTWWCGPNFFRLPIEEWPIKSHAECQHSSSSQCETEPISTMVTEVQRNFIDYERFSSMRKLKWVIARIVAVFKRKSFRGGCTCHITVDDLRTAEKIVLKDVQRGISKADTGKKGRYRKLNPVKNSDGLWVVGRRLSECHTEIRRPAAFQVLLPPTHYVTRLLMMQAHEQGGHRGRDSTLVRFRQCYWTPRGSKLAGQIRSACQLCRLREPQLFSPEMGVLPIERLRPGPPFNSTMVDLFGPYPIRGEVQKRVTGKAYGVLFTDICSRAVHIEGVFGYDTASFIMALTRFVSVRGWPQTIFSDPGTQLVGASNELLEMWKAMDKDELFKLSTDNGTTWRFGPADSPWEQGAVEALVKAVKKCFRYTFGEQRISASEFLTVCYQAASVINERPLGVLPSGNEVISVLTPNCQLIGRPYGQNPGGWKCSSDVQGRLRLVEELANTFWKRWTEAYLPTLMIQQKWFKSKGSSDIQVGDIVVVSDSNALRGKYRIATVSEVFPSRDGVVRRVALQYKTFRAGEKVHEYTGSRSVTVLRSVRRLAPLVRVGCDDTPGSQ